MLRWRLLLGPILILALAGIFRADAAFGTLSPVLLAFAVFLAARGTWELAHLFRGRPFRPGGLLVFACSTAVIAANWLPWSVEAAPTLAVKLSHVAPALLALVFAGMLLLTIRAFRYAAPGGNLDGLGLEWLCVFYLGGLLSLTAQLRWIRLELGYLPLASAVVVAKVADTMAYFSGKTFRGPKLAPLLSPGKTWSGAIGGLIGAAVGAWLLFAVITPWCLPKAVPSLGRSIVFGLLVGTAGQIGDLCESLIKRDVGEKDSAPMLPGFGGLLDLLDSVSFAAPAAYLLWLLMPPVL